MATFDVTSIRAAFPALSKSQQVYMDNAGGSQILQSVIDAITTYLSTNNVQLGASYPISQCSTELFGLGCAAAAKYMHTTANCVVLGPSTTQLFRNLSQSLYEYIGPGDELVVSLLDHEANISSWVQLAKDRQATLKWWSASDQRNPRLEADELRGLLTPRTKLVACTHTSNILGTIHDVKAIAAAVHEVPGALLCVDAVAYAPHRAVDVAGWGVDFYAFSWYKVYGPHLAVLYASPTAQTHLRSLGHFFHGTATLENLLGLAAANYELTASIPSVCQYLQKVPWDHIAAHEEKMQAILLEYLNSRPDVFTIYGEPTPDQAKRVPVISFTVKGWQSKDVVKAIEAKSDYGCRWGTFYSVRLAEQVLGVDPVDGVVRVSLVHYNTEEEVKGYVKCLDEVISEK